MQYQLCRHIRTNGKRCKSPQRTGFLYCYFHQRLRSDHQVVTRSISTTDTTVVLGPNGEQIIQHFPNPALLHLSELNLPPLEDAESIQVAISLVVTALGRNRIDPRRAGPILYGLQLASGNVRKATIEPFHTTVVQDVTESDTGEDLAPEVTEED